MLTSDDLLARICATCALLIPLTSLTTGSTNWSFAMIIRRTARQLLKSLPPLLIPCYVLVHFRPLVYQRVM